MVLIVTIGPQSTLLVVPWMTRHTLVRLCIVKLVFDMSTRHLLVCLWWSP